MQIRLQATEDTPHYLAELCFSRDGNDIVLQVVDANSREKARFDCPVTNFKLIADVLLAASGEKEGFSI